MAKNDSLGLHNTVELHICYDFPSGFLLEFQYNPNIPKIYHLSVENYSWDVKIYRSSFILYLGYILRGEGK